MKAISTHFMRLFLLIVCSFCLFSHTMPAALADEPIIWTQAELDFMTQHPEIHLGVDPTFVPYEFYDTDGVYKGIAADYIQLISQMTGLTMTVAEDLTWAQAYEKAVAKKLDVLPCVSKTTEREKYFLFSQGYYTFQRVIFINENSKLIKSFDDLKGKRVAVQVNSSHHSFLMDHPEISLGLFTTAEEGLEAVSDGTEVAFVGNLSTSSYLIKKYGIANLRYITIPSEAPQQLHFAVRDDWPILVGILNKALNAIGQEERIAINNKWISIQPDADYSALFQTLTAIGGLVAIIWTVSLFWILRLRKEIARRKKAQEEMNLAKTEAENANQVKSLFLARMSHEIRTPLSAIMGMSYLIKKTGLTDTQSNYLEKLNQSTRNMLGIITDILDFSKIESGKIEIERISFDLEKLIQRITNIISVKVDEKQLEFIIHEATDMPSQFIGDPTRIEQILINLVNNAVKFTPEGRVSLTVRAQKKAGSVYLVTFSVQDTGIGMNEEQVQRLFVPFDQADSSISRRFGGTGLGLSIVKNLTELMDGCVEVHSELGKGSTFTVQLPLEAEPNTVESSSRRMAADCFSTVHALVLDASEHSRSMISDCLKAFGITHDTTTNEQEALLALRQAAAPEKSSFNLFIVDHNTPQEGGIAFLENLQKQAFYPHDTKSVLLVPMTRDDLLAEVNSHGIDVGLCKPIVPSSLYNAIVELLGIDPPKKETAAADTETLALPYPYHILLVEDNKTNQFIAQQILEAAGFSLSLADNGQDGYDFFQAHRWEIDLILMDIHMPIMDGYTATNLIRAVDQELPIIAMTADAIVGVEEQCRIHGINHYVSKPFEPENLIHIILETLKRRPPRKDSAFRHVEEEAPLSAPVLSPEEETPATGSAHRLMNETHAPTTMDAPLLDSKTAMTQLGIDLSVYQAILQEYLKENTQTSQLLQAQVEAGDFAAAALTAHKVKSSTSSIGAKPLAECAAKLQKALQANDASVVLQEHTRFQTLFANTMQEIKSIL